MSRFPFSERMPIGWYQMAYSDELLAGHVVPLRYFARDLVLWRDPAGTARLLDAYCPHLGAHLGYGGTVGRDGIVCPFHEWKFDGRGRCIDIPYSERLNHKARIRDYPVVERNGMVWGWWHPLRGEPSWEVPVVPEHADDAYTGYRRFDWKIRSSPQELGENSVDIAHFKYVHGTVVIPDLAEVEQDGPSMRIRTVHQFDTPRGPWPGSIESQAWGFGFGTVRFRGIVDTCLVTSAVPVDDEHVHLKFSFTYRQLEDLALSSTVGDALVADIRRQIVEDTPIWEHKVYLDTPALADTDGPVMAYRRWAAQFYADAPTGASA